MALNSNQLVALRELQHATDDGDVAAIVRTLREHPADPVLQCTGLSELRVVLSVGVELHTALAQAAIEAGALALATAALRTHNANADVQQSAAYAFMKLAQVFPAEVGASGAIEAAVTGMRNHAANYDVQLKLGMVQVSVCGGSGLQLRGPRTVCLQNGGCAT